MSIPPSLVPDSITVTLSEFVKAAQPAPGTDSRIYTFSMFQFSDVEIGTTPSFSPMTNDWFTQAFIPVLKQYALAEIIDSTVQYVPNALTYGGSDQLSIAHI
jgi:hypothetical protein